MTINHSLGPSLDLPRITHTRALSARPIESVALISLVDRSTHVASLEALLAAALAHAFVLPSFRSTRDTRKRLRHITLVNGDELDLRRASAAARGNNLVRWLTAL